MRSPTSSEDSQTVLLHSIVVAPQMSLTEDVQGALLVRDAVDERAHLVGDEVVHLDGDAVTAGRVHELGRLFDRLRPVHLRALRPRRTAR